METLNNDQSTPQPQPLLKFKRLPHGKDLTIPTYTNSGAVGMDVVAAEDASLKHGETVMIATGFAAELPEGYELQVRSRSGLAAKHGVFVTNGPGTIDPDYRGEIKILLSRINRGHYQVKRGDRIAQLVLAPVVRAITQEVEALSTTDRNDGGFGSTGR